MCLFAYAPHFGMQPNWNPYSNSPVPPIAAKSISPWRVLVPLRISNRRRILALSRETRLVARLSNFVRHLPHDR